MNLHYSIIIPCYNHLDLTIQCLNSIVRNSNINSLEIILVDDGSTDGTTNWERHFDNSPNISYIYHPSREGFPIACNEGMKRAKGDYIVLLNNDTLVSPDWLQHLENALLEARRRLKNPNFHLVGPVSNNVPGSQLIKSNAGPSDIDSFGTWYYTNNKGKINNALFLSGFCLMFSKTLYQKIGGFDERFSPGGYEDRDFCLRTQIAGYLGIIALDTFIYHHGHRTIDEFPELDRGHHNRWKYFNKWRCKPKKLVALYHVQDTHYLKESLASINDAVDEIIILDSSHKAGLITPLFPKVTICQDLPLGHIKADKVMPKLTALAKSTGAEWFLLMHENDIIESKFTREYAEKLMNPLIPDTLAYEFSQFNTLDNYFANQRDRRFLMQRSLFAPNFITPGWLYMPEDAVRPCALRIKHILKKMQPVPTALLPWNEKNRIALVTIMKNEAKDLDSFLEHVYLIFDEIILVDTGSTDDSRQIAERWGARVVDFKWKDHFGMARNFALSQTNAEWIFQLDIDEKVEDIKEIYSMINSGKDAFLFTIADFQPGGKVSFPSSVRLFRNQKNVHYEGMIHETVVESLQRIKGLQVNRATTKIAHYGRLRPGTPKRIKYYQELVEDALRRNQNDPLLHFHQALMDRDARDLESALKHLQQAAQTGWEKPIIRMELANTHLLSAYTLYQTLKDIDPGDPYYEDVMKKLAMLRNFFPE